MENLFLNKFNVEAVKQLIASCPADEVVILCPHWSINKPNYDNYPDPEAFFWDWDEFEEAIGCTVQVNDYDDLIADPHGIMDN